MSQLPWNISVGLWFVEGKGGDRFTSAHKQPLPILDRIDVVGKMRGVRAIEMHYPYEVTDENFDAVRKRARDNGLKVLTISPGLFNETRFKQGALTSLKPEVRKEAIERVKHALAMDEELRKNGEGGEFCIIWPGTDGTTYSFECYHPDHRKRLRDGLVEALESVSGAIALEHKPSDPASKTYYGTTGEAILLVRDMRRALAPGGETRVGMNPELAHLLMANAMLGSDISLILEEGMLMHTHWNTIQRLGADNDLMVGSDNWNETMEVFFWLEEFQYKGYLGLDLWPKNEDTVRAVEVSIQAMERMYAEMMSVRDRIKQIMLNPDVDVTHTQELMLKARGAPYQPVV